MTDTREMQETPVAWAQRFAQGIVDQPAGRDQWLVDLCTELVRLRDLAEVKYELLASERAFDVLDELEPRIAKLYMGLNARHRYKVDPSIQKRYREGQALMAAFGLDAPDDLVFDLDGEHVKQWDRLIEALVTALVHWVANARWAVLEHRIADNLRAALLNGVWEGTPMKEIRGSERFLGRRDLSVVHRIEAILDELPYGSTPDEKANALFDIRMIIKGNDDA
jgi:hypothetical protein